MAEARDENEDFWWVREESWKPKQRNECQENICCWPNYKKQAEKMDSKLLIMPNWLVGKLTIFSLKNRLFQITFAICFIGTVKRSTKQLLHPIMDIRLMWLTFPQRWTDQPYLLFIGKPELSKPFTITRNRYSTQISSSKMEFIGSYNEEIRDPGTARIRNPNNVVKLLSHRPIVHMCPK